MVGHERQWREDQSLSKGVHLKMWGDDVDFHNSPHWNNGRGQSLRPLGCPKLPTKVKSLNSF